MQDDEAIGLRLGEELRVLHGNGGFTKWLLQVARVDVLLLDDWGMAPLDAMVRNDLLRYADMLKHGTPLTNQVYGPVTQDLQQLAQVVLGGQALAYSMANLDVQFRNTFKGYNQAFSPTAYYQNYQQWSQTSLDTTHSTLKAMGLQGAQLQNEQTVLAALHQMMQTPIGRMQAIQIGSDLSEQQVEQLMKLRQLMILDLQSKQAYQAEQIQKQQADVAAQQQFFNYVPVQGDGITFPLP